ncbi:uncharacterized protein OCT59_016080 [Rhizophagus irregularis]|uniref:Uncharacterized protein n=5 Tax=Rhizophagus irregularis TaxID=588596 RepID=A0A2I1EIK1_9GLOM|nr:hypothetical protein GLOIN_2v1870011 [Rhizophagus irregularis DAOM 181602=DAOM 197198]EXX51374.1 hypothetical protein RirG_262460 [Rhizophagus irregularis DAOM 197198w]PKY21946.1 hypothetical protein RhiirB3_410073 [Rhizophagus irregularis]POG79102.1 hypothetical protein GLOIN_2v1870011 [Rhizophagus irregularis DAOM 181602=DAOM 197198]UZO23749.1 hypothetical protein OCT59_016080 [Rhizophagus irregularis]CAB4380827.1 unnamed protein product [Rhizophagus irregularis]|eukprot:XP_025185968.1 hypothetical protein GLOIN_2v1870011 [Rhizophagus irregularis DAOM 181602=DAOM 197198]
MDENRSLPACFSLPLSRPIYNEQALNSSHVEKQILIKRRKYMTMPLTEKQVKNLADKRKFRQCNYIRTLETKTSQLETLYESAQKEIKSLRERITILEKRLTSSGIDGYYCDVNLNDDNIDNSLTSSAKKHNLI